MRVFVHGVGGSLPRRRVDNAELSLTLDTSDEWISSRTGISARHVCGEGETPSTLAIAAARQALSRSNIQPGDIQAVIVATCSPDLTFPAVANLVACEIGCETAVAFDIQAACSGFIHGLAVVRGLMATCGYKNILLIGAEVFSKLVDWNDRNTAVLFGDGAGAAVLSTQASGAWAEVLAVKLFGDATGIDLLKSTGGTATTQTAGVVSMNGREVFKHGVRGMAEAVRSVVGNENIDWLVPHQANSRLMHAVGEALNLPPEKLISSVAEHANTSAASIPLALNTAIEGKKLKPRQHVVLTAFGAGFSYGGALLKVLE